MRPTKVHLMPTLSAAWKAKVKFLLWGKEAGEGQ